uniref:Uncharacterized protein n=1 Tax=Timema shepardi TaxID=629360 RepID=A0A7R9AR21_TIMSH|nr:unnamed protein product [Timema shepardi]
MMVNQWLTWLAEAESEEEEEVYIHLQRKLTGCWGAEPPSSKASIFRKLHAFNKSMKLGVVTKGKYTASHSLVSSLKGNIPYLTAWCRHQREIYRISQLGVVTKGKYTVSHSLVSSLKGNIPLVSSPEGNIPYLTAWCRHQREIYHISQLGVVSRGKYTISHSLVSSPEGNIPYLTAWCRHYREIYHISQLGVLGVVTRGKYTASHSLVSSPLRYPSLNSSCRLVRRAHVYRRFIFSPSCTGALPHRGDCAKERQQSDPGSILVSSAQAQLFSCSSRAPPPPSNLAKPSVTTTPMLAGLYLVLRNGSCDTGQLFEGSDTNSNKI